VSTGQRRRVLIVDDEPLLVRSFTRILERDHDVTAFSSSREALGRIEAGESWDVILCDLHMPELDGVAFFERLSRARPELAAHLAFITGGAFTPRARAFLESTTRPTIEKPLHPEALRALVARMAP
jgi:CheY-like chemotaxis protein